MSKTVTPQKSRHSSICSLTNPLTFRHAYYWFPLEMTPADRTQKLHTDEVSLPTSDGADDCRAPRYNCLNQSEALARSE